MKTSDHFIGQPAASLPGTPVLGTSGAGFHALDDAYDRKGNDLSRPTLICPSCFQK